MTPPRKRARDKKSERIQIKATKAESRAIRASARRSRQSVSAWCLSVLLARNGGEA